jgi:cobalt-zinc-cadmium efflux system protein
VSHDHDHDGAGHHHHNVMGRKALGLALLLTGGFCVAEAVAGFITGSLALISDATHMLTDTLGLIVAFVAATLRTRPAAGRSTFGLRRLPVLGGMFNALFVLGASALIVTEALERIQQPRQIPGLPVVVVAVAGLVVNLVGAWWVHRSGDKSVNVRGALLHMLGDALGSVAALVSGLALLLGASSVVDPIASLVVAGIIAVGALRLLFDAGSILLERAPAHIDVSAVQQLAKASPAVSDVVGLHAWELDSGEAVASLVLVTPETDLVRLAAFADDIKRGLLERFHIHHATIEWRPTASPRPCCD